MSVTLYSTHCPRCIIIEKKLKARNVEYKEVNDVEAMKKKGFTAVPILEVDGDIMDFKSANDWLNSLEANNGN